MPLPAIQNNTPSAGFITWPALGMQFMGQSFNISSGNTNQKYLIWKWNGGAPSLLTANTVPTDLVTEDKVLILNHNGKGSFVDFTDRIFGDLLVDGTVVAEAIAANAINATHIEANAISATHIGGNVIQGKHISAGTLTADKLSVGTVSDNLVVNGSFEDALSGSLVGWEVSAMTAGTITPVTGVASSGAVSIQFDATATTANLRLRQMAPQLIPVSSASGRRMYVSARMGVSVATTVGNYVRVYWYDANKVVLTSGGQTDIRSNGALTTTFTIYEGQVTPPAAARYMGIEILLVNPNVVTKLYLDEVTVHEVTMSAQIGDGQITAAKITTNTITADRIAAGAITVDKLAITDQQNYVRDPGLEFNGAGWSLPTGGTIATIADPRIDGTKVLQIVGGSSTRDATTGAFPVREDDWYYASCYVRSVGTASTSTGDVHFGATIVLTGTNQYSWPRLTGLPANQVPTTWTRWEGTMKMPAGARTLQLRPSVRAEVANGTFQFDDFQLRRMNGGELIVDGAIYAEKIAANAISANHIGANIITAIHLGANTIGAKHIAGNVITGDMIGANVIYGKHIDADVITTAMIQANAITSNLILANAVGAEEIAANAIYAQHIFTGAVTGDKIEANAINGKTITGATIQTSNTATGARVVMNSTGLKAWDANNINYLVADQNGLKLEGELTAKGITMGTPFPMTATVGNLDQAGQHGLWNTLGVHFSRDDKVINPDGGYMPPAMTSADGEGLFMTSAQNPNPAGGNYPMSYLYLSESQLDLKSNCMGGINIVNEAADQGNVNISAYGTNSSVWLQALGGTVQTWANDVTISAENTLDLYGPTLRVNGNVRNTTSFAPIATTDAQRDGLFDFQGPMEGDAVVRTDRGGITQRFIDGKWTGFAGSVAYVVTQNGYNNYSRGYPTTHAYLGPDGRTYLGGMFSITSTGSVSILANTVYTMGTLPVGYRPPYPLQFKQAVSQDLGDCNVGIGTDGAITYRLAAAKTLSNGNTQFWISLEGISWRNTNC